MAVEKAAGYIRVTTRDNVEQDFPAEMSSTYLVDDMGNLHITTETQKAVYHHAGWQSAVVVRTISDAEAEQLRAYHGTDAA